MKLYISQGPDSHAVQFVANELELSLQLVHYDICSHSTSDGENFQSVNPLGHAPVLKLDDGHEPFLTEATVISTYLANHHQAHRLIPEAGACARVAHDQLLAFTAFEITSRQGLLERKLINPKGVAYFGEKLSAAYRELDRRLQDGRAYFLGDEMTVVDAHVWATVRQGPPDLKLKNLKHLGPYISRMEALPSAAKTLTDSVMIAAGHKAFLAAD